MSLPRLEVLALFVASACASPAYSPADVRARESAPVYTADGRVLGVEGGAPGGSGAMVVVTLEQNDRPPIRVELAPGWYLDDQGLRFSKEDQVQIEGHRETRSGSTVLVAHRVQKGSTAVDLRDAHAEPVWAH